MSPSIVSSRSTLSALLFLILSLFLFIQCSSAGKINFGGDRDNANDQLTDYKLFRFGMFTKNGSPGIFAKKKSYIEVDVTFERANKRTKKDPVISYSTIIYHAKNKKNIGYTDKEGRLALCCTPDLFDQGLCGYANETGQVIYYDPTPSMLIDTEKMAVGKFKVDIGTKKFVVTNSGVYYVVLIGCGNTTDTTLEGEVYYRNPFGELSGELYYYMPFYFAMTMTYILMSFIWIGLTYYHWDQILVIQNCIFAVIVMGAIECATWYFEYMQMNDSGLYHLGAWVIAIFVATMKRTVSRLLVLTVAMGFGVVKGDLGTDKFKVMFLGLAYFTFSGALEVSQTSSTDQSMTTMLVVPVALLDTIFYWWIFISIMRTISQLTLRKQEIKLDMYKKLFYVLIASVLFSVLMVMYQLLIGITTDPDTRWRTTWIWDAYWNVLYLGILIAICVLWVPTENNTRYAYNELKDVDDEVDEVALQPMNSSAVGDLKTRTSEGILTNKKAAKEQREAADAVKIELPDVPAFEILGEEDEMFEAERSKMQ
eukprot:TRINITY_DN3599_c0_g2_i1.p1 TRINITY_DN3599_c0_g2~~TRINITY_DN3599_c0_g2_i1.p1  ORF type:complete len:538 (+),score=139.89 TRINITY_DN3599_c0_g2_i1:351-1964(+)